jgi:hypothetical protein
VKVILGSNEFVDCPTLIAYKGKPVLRVTLNPLRVSLDPPSDLPSVELRHVTTERSDAVIAGQQAIAIGTLIDPDTVHLALDLRPIGMNVVADVGGIRIGKTFFVGNVIERMAVGINLG